MRGGSPTSQLWSNIIIDAAKNMGAFALTNLGSIDVLANEVRFTDVALARYAAAGLQIGNFGMGAYRSLRVDNLFWNSALTALGMGQNITARDQDTAVVSLQARDSGVGLVTVARLVGAAEPRLEQTLPLNLGAPVVRVIAGGAITVGNAALAAWYTLQGEGGLVDDLTDILAGAIGDVIVLRVATLGYVITAKHNVAKLRLAGAADLAFNTTNVTLTLICVDGTIWTEIARAAG